MLSLLLVAVGTSLLPDTCEDTPIDLKCSVAAQPSMCRISCDVARQCKGTCVHLGDSSCSDMILREFALCPIEPVTTSTTTAAPANTYPPLAPQPPSSELQMPASSLRDIMICCAKAGYSDEHYDCSSSTIPEECAIILNQLCEWTHIEECEALHGFL